MEKFSAVVLVDPDSPVFTKGMGLRAIQRLFSVEFGQTIYNCIQFRGRGCVPVFRYTLDPHELEQLSQNWRSAIAEHPGAYLAHRWALTRYMLTTNGKRPLYYLEGAPHGPVAEEHPPSARLLWMMSFMERHIRSAVYTPWIYVVLGLLLLPFTLPILCTVLAPFALLRPQGIEAPLLRRFFRS